MPPGVLERGLLLKMRFELDHALNLRPVKLPVGVESPIAAGTPESIDMVVCREGTEGLYCGAGGFLRKDTVNEVATEESINTWHGVERLVRNAFARAQARPRQKLTLVHKTNVLVHAGNLYQRVVNHVAEEFPEVSVDYCHIDAATIFFVTDPGRFDVIVTDNMFGDIITDLGAAIQGGLGIAAGGNINPDPDGVSMFEPIGGSAPKYKGKNMINPLAAISSVDMMLRHLGEVAAGKSIEAAIMRVTERKLKSLAAGRMGYTTTQVGDLVCEALA